MNKLAYSPSSEILNLTQAEIGASLLGMYRRQRPATLSLRKDVPVQPVDATPSELEALVAGGVYSRRQAF